MSRRGYQVGENRLVKNYQVKIINYEIPLVFKIFFVIFKFFLRQVIMRISKVARG